MERLRRDGFSRLDTFTPFPVHGMDRALGLGPSLLGYLVFIGGSLGLLSGYLLQWWTSEVDYSINISNKPFFAIEPSIPISFELQNIGGDMSSAANVAGGLLLLFGGLFLFVAATTIPMPPTPSTTRASMKEATDDAKPCATWPTVQIEMAIA